MLLLPYLRTDARHGIFLESVVQASIVIITTTAGKLQDDTSDDSLDPAVTLWLVYAFLSVAISGALLLLSYTMPTLLPAARLSQITPRSLPDEVDLLCARKGIVYNKMDQDGDVKEVTVKERLLKAPYPGREGVRWLFLVASIGIIFIGWIMFGLGVGWGVHGSVIAGTVGE